jgi:AcrR family transcriptional regulator
MLLILKLQRGRSGRATELLSQGQETRRKISARALRIGAREGLAALTIGRLAKELRMSKSGLFARFDSKQALELATLEMARNLFADAVLRPAQASRGGIERLWNLYDLWLRHIEQRIFAGPYFFTGAYFEYAAQSGPIAQAITRIAQEWLDTIRKAVREAQQRKEIREDLDAKQIARELNGELLGAHWAYLLKGSDCCGEARVAFLARLQELSVGEIPAKAFTSVEAWKKHLQQKR